MFVVPQLSDLRFLVNIRVPFAVKRDHHAASFPPTLALSLYRCAMPGLSIYTSMDREEKVRTMSVLESRFTPGPNPEHSIESYFSTNQVPPSPAPSPSPRVASYSSVMRTEMKDLSSIIMRL
ncbi:hypothetical protein FA13DRAFT_1739060, partial [Coprinellus micaceus]